MCPKCHSNNITYQTVSESKKTGCLTVLLYILLALTLCGLLIVIPLMLRKKQKQSHMLSASLAVSGGKYKILMFLL